MNGNFIQRVNQDCPGPNRIYCHFIYDHENTESVNIKAMNRICIVYFFFPLETLGQWKVPIDVPVATEKRFYILILGTGQVLVHKQVIFETYLSSLISVAWIGHSTWAF